MRKEETSICTIHFRLYDHHELDKRQQLASCQVLSIETLIDDDENDIYQTSAKPFIFQSENLEKLCELPTLEFQHLIDILRVDDEAFADHDINSLPSTILLNSQYFVEIGLSNNELAHSIITLTYYSGQWVQVSEYNISGDDSCDYFINSYDDMMIAIDYDLAKLPLLSNHLV